jgi:hypothetical protein
MAQGRLRVNRLTLAREAGRVRVDVELAHDDRTLVGSAEAAPGAAIRAAAAATTSALSAVLPRPWRLRLDEAVTQPIAQRQAVIVQLRLDGEEVEERLVGSAVADRIPEEAAVRAVLNAAERRATHLIS